MKKIINNIKYVKLKDVLGIIFLILAIIPAMVFRIINKIKNRELWLICETSDTARDNGYHLFKYIREEHPNDMCYYAINKRCLDYKKIEKYGNIIQFSSLKHWIYYLAADKNISTQKGGNPSAPIFYVLQVYGILKNKRVFLQHGVIKDDLPYVHYKNAKFRLFVCGGKDEYIYIKNHFGYPENYVQYLGLARFDNLYNNHINKKQIVIMPTWRNWLGRDVNKLSKKVDFRNTEYYKYWNGFLNNNEFKKIIESNNLVVYFYPHIHMQKFLQYFKSNSENIKIIDNSNIDIQDLLKESALMITDYSSVFMDFAYMKKPIIYYQFDKEKFRKQHLATGYFSYERDGFGEVVNDYDTLIERINKYIKNDFKNEDVYIKRSENFFELHDNQNCKRNYEAIKNI